MLDGILKKMNSSFACALTRRGILSTVGSLYNVMGFIAPVQQCKYSIVQIFFCRTCVENSFGTNHFAKMSELGLPGYKNCPSYRVNPFLDALECVMPH